MSRDTYYNSMVRRMVSLPRTLLGNFSRAMNQGIDLISPRTRRNQNQYLPSSFHTPYLQEPANIQEEWAFLATFEQQFGQFHPFFYACRFSEALKMAENEHKFVFLYLHSPDHPFAASFCKETLCSELVVQYLDSNFLSWGGLVSVGEGSHLASTLGAFTFPFCVVVAPASGDNLAVLQQMEGPVSPTQLVEILQRTIEEQGLAFGSARAKEEEKRRIERRLREEQDVAYLAALHIDQEEDRLKNLHLRNQRAQKRAQDSTSANNDKQKKEQISEKAINEKNKQNLSQKLANKLKESTSKEFKHKDVASGSKNAQITQILIRFPDGNRKEHSFVLTDKIQAIYTYIDSLCLPGVCNYRLVSNFPRKVFGVDQMKMTLKDTDLYPKATLFLELL